ncbi:hypothetical protein BJ741DRAFT_614442 [Chytriomyces cf. hyalinus JEL632]|nr:hypothetical protein BJ741DRAFT_614442 [Chytriomyces cf. hyalinus JEL632]
MNVGCWSAAFLVMYRVCPIISFCFAETSVLAMKERYSRWHSLVVSAPSPHSCTDEKEFKTWIPVVDTAVG